MRQWALLAIAICAAEPAWAQCPAAGEGSAERSISDVPYAPSDAAPCPHAEPKESWTAPTDERKGAFMRAGVIGVTLGAGMLLMGANFAVCAKHAPAGTAEGCRDATAPLLIAGAASAALGLGTLAVATWVLPDPTPAPRAARGLSAGLMLRLAWK